MRETGSCRRVTFISREQAALATSPPSLTYRVCEGGRRDGGVGVGGGGGGMGSTGGPSLGPKSCAHLRVSQDARHHGRHQHHCEDDHHDLHAAH